MKRIIISPPFGTYVPLFPWGEIDWATCVKGTYTAFPRKGNRFIQLIRTLRPIRGGWVNDIGLINKSVDAYDFKNPYHIYSFASGIGHCSEDLIELEWDRILGSIPSGKIVELNVSCPIIKEHQISKTILRRFKDKCNFVIIKLPPKAPLALKIVEDALDVDITTFHCCNTLSTERGGQSGRLLKYCSLNTIENIKTVYPDVTIIGGGGIYTPQDVLDYSFAGAEYFSLATIFFTPWKVPAVRREIERIYPR